MHVAEADAIAKYAGVAGMGPQSEDLINARSYTRMHPRTPARALAATTRSTQQHTRGGVSSSGSDSTVYSSLLLLLLLLRLLLLLLLLFRLLLSRISPNHTAWPRPFASRKSTKKSTRAPRTLRR